MTLQAHPHSLALATALGLHGYRKGSLSTSGAIAAATVGYLTLGNELRVFGHGLIAFYLIGSRATKYGAARKSTLETGHDPLRPSGNRSAVQVLCNSTPPLICSILFRALFTSERVGWVVDLVARGAWREEGMLGGDEDAGGRLARALVWASLGHFATTLADTLSSELGILSSDAPRLITNLKPCPPGTNGGVTTLGIGASLLGGGLMGAIMGLSLRSFPSGVAGRGLGDLSGWVKAGLADGRGGSIGGPGGLLGNGIMAFGTGGSNGDGLSTGSSVWLGIGKMVVYGAVAGLAGSLLDSLLGATCQQTRYDTVSRRVITGHDDMAVRSGNSHGPRSKREELPEENDRKTIVISGQDWLTNNGVNFVSSAAIAVGMGFVGYNL